MFVQQWHQVGCQAWCLGWPIMWTASDMVRVRCPNVPPPSSEWTEAALALRSCTTLVMDLYAGGPWMGGIVGWGKLSMRESTVVAIMANA